MATLFSLVYAIMVNKIYTSQILRLAILSYALDYTKIALGDITG